jgi:hypothetical protein
VLYDIILLRGGLLAQNESRAAEVVALPAGLRSCYAEARDFTFERRSLLPDVAEGYVETAAHVRQETARLARQAFPRQSERASGAVKGPRCGRHSSKCDRQLTNSQRARSAAPSVAGTATNARICDC